MPGHAQARGAGVPARRHALRPGGAAARPRPHRLRPIGAGIGPNAFPLQRLAGGRLLAAGLPVTIRKADGSEPLALAQGSDVIDRAARPLVPTTTLTAYEANPKSGTEQQEGGPSAWPAARLPQGPLGDGHRPQQVQRLRQVRRSAARPRTTSRSSAATACSTAARCRGCGSTATTTRPTKDGGWDAEVWDGPLDVVEEPQTLFEPMLCQHCENAPCETVCPFVATMHSEDGLNQQIYNRCVGTRYCANNCPFKVRRFNYWEYSKAQESAFFRWLVPRIARERRAEHARADADEEQPRGHGAEPRRDGEVLLLHPADPRAPAPRRRARATTKDHLPDGAVVPACMEACPTGAITFGDVNAPGSRVAALAAHPRAMKLLDALGVKPSISYLTKVRNDKA